MLVIFVVIDLFMMLAANFLTESTLLYKYGRDLLVEMFYILAILVVMLLFKNAYVFTDRRERFWNGVTLAIPLLVISLYNFANSIMDLGGFSISKFINVLILSIFIGIAEEFLCRGWLQNEFLERFSTNKKDIVKSIILASFIFGFMHIWNLNSQTLYVTILQIVNATSIGILLGTIYYKTKNIWSVIFLHSFYDFAIFLGEMNLVKDCTYGLPTAGIMIVDIVGCVLTSALWLLCAKYVFNKIDFDGEQVSLKKKNKINNITCTAMVIVFILLLVPLERFVPEYDDYKTCYTYIEIDRFSEYEVHYPNYNKYTIKYTESSDEELEGLPSSLIGNKYEFTFKMNPNRTISIRNEITGYEIKLEIDSIKSFEILKNGTKYYFIVSTTQNVGRVYLSDYFSEENMSNDNNYLNNFDATFDYYELPEISKIGYITLEDVGAKYPYMLSSANDEFVIIRKDLYKLKEK